VHTFFKFYIEVVRHILLPVVLQPVVGRLWRHLPLL